MDIAKALDVDPIWLSTGEGTMGPAKTPEQRMFGIDPWDKQTPLEDDEVEVPYLKDIEFACGDGSALNDDYNGKNLGFPKQHCARWELIVMVMAFYALLHTGIAWSQ